MKQLTTFYNNANLSSIVAHLALQLTICYGHSSLVEQLLAQYKVLMYRTKIVNVL